MAIVAPPLHFLFGGQEVQAHNLVTLWSGDRAARVTFVSSRPDTLGRLAIIEKIPYLRTAARFPSYIASLYEATQTVQILHVFAGSFSSFLIATAPAVLLGRILKKKVLIHYHNGRAETHLRKSRIARYIVHMCDAVVVPSPFLERIFRAHHRQVEVVPNVVDPVRFRYTSREPLRPRFVCTRNWEPHYGIDIVVRAFAKIQREFPEATLCLVGRGSSEPTLRKLVKDLGLNNTSFERPVHPDEMHALYEQCDIFLNGSYVDCSPVSILESFCAGLPVVTTSAGGIRDLVEDGETGLLSPPGDWEGLGANAIRILRQPDFARDLARRARAKAESHSWHNVRDRWLSIYQHLLRSE